MKKIIVHSCIMNHNDHSKVGMRELALYSLGQTKTGKLVTSRK